ncbi:MAG: LacI family DNA-binding transcriptional regulator [Spirochaetales bacterium]|nr:LacI family DNA-binding transcriptional regulator [Spirochaetales bacterium]
MSIKKVTVYDIAEELGISSSTVSRVLNNSSLIGDDRRKMILDTAQRLGYKKRTIKKQSGRAILNIRLFLPPAKYNYIHLFYDVAELILGLQKGFDDVKANIITSINDGDLSLIESKKLGDIDGCVFAFTVPSDELESYLEEKQIPIILLNREQPENNYVMIDNKTGMQKLADAVIKKRGDVKPCYIGFNPIERVSQKRQQGLIEAFKAKGQVIAEEDIFNVTEITEISESVIGTILKRGYNAVFCFNDIVAVAMYHAVLHEGLSLPDCFSLTGFDNSPVLKLLDKPINTINFSVETLGYEAGVWLRSWVVERKCESMQKKIDGEYIQGETV